MNPDRIIGEGLKLLMSNDKDTKKRGVKQIKIIKNGKYLSDSKGVRTPNYTLEKFVGGSFLIKSQQNNIFKEYLFNEKGESINKKEPVIKKVIKIIKDKKEPVKEKKMSIEEIRQLYQKDPVINESTISYPNKKGEMIKIRLPTFNEVFLKKPLRDLDKDREDFLKGKYLLKKMGGGLFKSFTEKEIKRMFPQNSANAIINYTDKYRKKIIFRRETPGSIEAKRIKKRIKIEKSKAPVKKKVIEENEP